MKILLINPDFTKDAGRDLYTADIASSVLTSQPFKKAYAGIPLSLTTLASVTPSKHSVKIVDEAIEAVLFDETCDVVCITAMTFKAPRAYEIAQEFKKRGKKVIMGGIHASMCPDEAAQHVDCVVIGEAEEIWPGILEDFERGALKKKYKAEQFTDITKLPPPSYDKVKFSQYLFIYIQTSRGCPFNCEFCTVTTMNGRKMRFKSPAQVIKEIDTVLNLITRPIMNVKDRRDGKIKPYYATFFFTDDNFAIRREHAIEVCKEIIEYQKRTEKQFTWFTQVNSAAGLDNELLSIMAEANCQVLFIGFESLDPESLKAMNKTMNAPEQYGQVVQNLRQHGIECVFSTIIGTDFDTPKTADAIINFVDENKVFYVHPNILTPYPGTNLYKKMLEENRLTSTNPGDYNIRNVVHIPKRMKPYELQKAFVKLCNGLFSYDKMIHRSSAMRSMAHKTQRYTIPVPLRIISLIFFSFLATIMAFQGRIQWKLLLKTIYHFASIVVRYGTIIDFCVIAYALDHDAFARSEDERFKKNN